MGNCLIFFFRLTRQQWMSFWHRIEVPSDSVGSLTPLSWNASSAEKNISALGYLGFTPDTAWDLRQWSPQNHSQGPDPIHLLSLTFLGYLYGAVTDFTCCCSSLVSWSRSWDRNFGVRTMKAFTTCSEEAEWRLRASDNQIIVEGVNAWDFPGGPVVKTPCSHHRGRRFDP